jgi:hypothetical protein
MKPNFALNLSLDGIDLFHRSATGWTHVGTVSLDDSDLTAALGMLRSTAVSLAAGSLTTKVIIPETQILYTEVEAGPETASPEARDAAIRAALEGRTPYPVSDLVFDARPRGRKVELAVLARETLVEAEAFARDHRFNPVSFVAAPTGGRFGGAEPFFGTADSAREMIRTLGEPERDAEALDLDALKRVRPAAPDEVPVVPEPEGAGPEEPDAGEATPEAAEGGAGPGVTAPVLDEGSAGPVGTSGVAEAETPVAEVAEAAAEAAPVDAAPAVPDAGEVAAAALPEAPPTFTSRRAARMAARAGRQTAKPKDEASGPAGAAAAAEPEAAASEPPAAAPTPPQAGEPPAAEAPAAEAPAKAATERPRLVASKSDIPLPRSAGPSEPVPLRRGPPRAPADAPVAVKAFLRNQQPGARRSPVIDLGNLRAMKGQAGAAPALELPPDPVPDDDVPPVPEAQRTVFGARREPVERRSPMRIVVMTLVLLLVLAGLALWSTFWQDGGDPAEVAALPGGDTLAPVEGGVPPAEAEAEADLAAIPEPDVPEPALDGTAQPEVVPEAEPPVAAVEPVPDVAPQPEPAEPEAAPPPEAAAPAIPADPAAAALERGDAARALPDDAAALTPTDDPAPEGALPDASAAAAEVDLTAPAVEEAAVDEAAADAAPVPDMPALPADPVTELVGTDEGAADRVREQLAAELTPEVAERIYADRGLWVMGPAAPTDPGAESADDIAIAAIDPAIAGQDAVALPGLSTDRSILPPPPPAPAGTVFDFDERGLVRATPEGAVNPDGILIFQGRPPVAPAPRDPAAAPAATEAPADPTLVAPDNPLSRIKPRPRPDDLSETTERALLGGRTLADLSQIKPRSRPASVVAAAEAPAGTEPAIKPASELAVARSLTPRRRSDEIVALASASRAMAVKPPPEAPAPEPAPVVAAKPAPKPEPEPQADVAEADAEVEVASAAVVAPSIPTKAGVAKTATVANAISLSKTNLIGVFGTQSSRRALVRLSSGKYVKVKVGDRLDGGKVAAIGDSSLVYVKSGNQVKLSLPKT